MAHDALFSLASGLMFAARPFLNLKGQPSHCGRLAFFGETMTHTYSTEELEQLVKIAARIVVKHGERYLPIFDRLRRELDLSRQRSSSQKAALELARQYADDAEERF